METSTVIVITVFSWIILLLIIAYFARRRALGKKPADFVASYFLGGRSLGWLVAGLSTAVTTYSVGTFIGGPGTAYSLGYMWVFMGPFQGLGVLLMFTVLGKKLAIVGRRINAVTIMDVIRARYGSVILELIGAVATVLFLAAYILPQFFGGARALEATTGFPYVWGLVAFLVLCGIYTTLGGFLGESWADTISAIMGSVLFAVLIVAVLAATGQYGGIGGISETLEGMSPLFVQGAPSLFYLGMSMIVLVGVGMLCFPHASIRVMATKDVKSMKYAIVVGTIWMAIANLTVPVIGTWGRVFFPSLAAPDLVVPTMIVTVLPPIIAGLIVAIIVGEALNTIDSLLLTVSSTFLKNVAVAIKPNIKPESRRRLTYILMVVVNAFIICFALFPPPELIWLNLYAVGGLVAIYFTSLIVGLYWKRANKYGALVAMISGIPIYIIFDMYLKPYLGGINAIVPAFIIANLLMIVVSLLTPKPSREIIKTFWGKKKE